MSQTLTVPFDDDVLLTVGLTSREFTDIAKFTVAAKFYMDGKLTAGQAAKLCGMGKVEFLYELPRHGYAISNIGPDAADDELELARMEMARGK